MVLIISTAGKHLDAEDAEDAKVSQSTQKNL